MKHRQDIFFVGYVTLSVTGENPELFFQRCVEWGIHVWDVRKIGQDRCEGNIRLKDVKWIRKIRREKRYKIKFIKKRGLPFVINRVWNNKHWLMAMISGFLFIFILSNILWSITIVGVSPEIEVKIRSHLKEEGIQKGRWLFLMNTPGVIQQKLLQDVPELLWIGIEKKGTTFRIEGVEKVIVGKEEKKRPQHIVASKKGVIQSMFVTEGISVVSVNDYVERGDLLVSGVLSLNENDEAEVKYVSAEAEVRAKTWYELSVTVPIEMTQSYVTGEKEIKYFLGIGNKKLLIYGFGKSNFKEVNEERIENRLRFLMWDLPVSVTQFVAHEKEDKKITRTVEEATKIGIEQAKRHLKLTLGNEVNILSEKVLQQSLDNGKVNLNLFITVEENIAKKEPITQGD